MFHISYNKKSNIIEFIVKISQPNRSGQELSPICYGINGNKNTKFPLAELDHLAEGANMQKYEFRSDQMGRSLGSGFNERNT